MRPEWRTSFVFAASGVVQSSWFSRLPGVRDQVHADIPGIGVALAVLGSGTLVAIIFAGVACRRFGCRPVVMCATAVSCASLATLGYVRSFALLVAVLLIFGVALGAWDGAMNVQGVAQERADRRRWMTTFHGWWSVGSVVGAGIGVAAAEIDIPLSQHLGLAAATGAGVCLVGAAGFATGGAHSLRRVHERRNALRLGMVALLILVGATIEGAAGDWLAIYLDDHRELSADASTGYAVFVVAVAGGRFAANVSHHVIGVTATVRVGAALAAAGVLVVVSVPVAGAAMIGAFFWGLGICGVFPAALSAAGSSGSGGAVVAMTGIGYAAGVVGPIIISRLAGTDNLGAALLVLPGLAVILIIFARHLDRHDAESEAAG